MRWRSLLVDPDVFDSDSYIRITLSISVVDGKDCKLAATEILRILTLRTQTIQKGVHPAIPEVTGAVLHVGHAAPWTEVTLALPPDNYVVHEGLGRLLELLTSAVEYNYASGVWIHRVDLPKQYLIDLPGPQLGVLGIRKLLEVASRPLLALEIGPRSSSLSNDDLQMYSDVLTNGADLLVDDMLMGDPPGDWNFNNRVELISKVCDQVSQRIGRRKGYVTCLAGRPRSIKDKVDWARSRGIDGFVINAFTHGFGNLEELALDSDGYAIFTTNMGSGIASRPLDHTSAPRGSRRVGVDEQVFSKLSRLGGADAVHTGTSGTQCVDIPWGDAVKALEQPIVLGSRSIPSSLRVAEGDLQLKDLWPNVRELGADTIFEVATAITGSRTKARQTTSTFISVLEELAEASSSEDALAIYRRSIGRDRALENHLDTIDLSSW